MSSRRNKKNALSKAAHECLPVARPRNFAFRYFLLLLFWKLNKEEKDGKKKQLTLQPVSLSSFVQSRSMHLHTARSWPNCWWASAAWGQNNLHSTIFSNNMFPSLLLFSRNCKETRYGLVVVFQLRRQIIFQLRRQHLQIISVSLPAFLPLPVTVLEPCP